MYCTDEQAAPTVLRHVFSSSTVMTVSSEWHGCAGGGKGGKGDSGGGVGGGGGGEGEGNGEGGEGGVPASHGTKWLRHSAAPW